MQPDRLAGGEVENHRARVSTERRGVVHEERLLARGLRDRTGRQPLDVEDVAEVARDVVGVVTAVEAG